MSIVSCIKSFDFFGESFTFKVKKQKYYTSIVGGLASIGFVIYSLYYIIWSLFDFLDKRDRTLEREIKSISESSVDLAYHDYFKVALCYRDSSMAVDKRMKEFYNLQSFMVDDKLQSKRLVSQSSPLSASDCKQDFFKEAMKDLYSLEDFEGCDCLVFSDKEEFRTQFNVVDKK